MPEESQLIDVAKTFPTLHIDLKYATADNITGRPIYQHAACLLHTDAATALAKAISIAALAGLKLVVYDAYRPQNTWWMSQLALTTAGAPPLTSR